MLIVATAGHVDHGKSTLLRALTKMEPDRWLEERRRGLTIDLGFVWTTLPDGQTVAFVDVPGHERYVPNMLSGVAEVPTVLFVVAADEGWRAQSEEHLAALHAYGTGSAILVVTRSDLADPEPVMSDAVGRLEDTSLSSSGPVPSVAVSAATGAGLDELRLQLMAMGRETAPADPRADVRLWLDRSFSLQGVGAVVTGSLIDGSLEIDDPLSLLTQHGQQSTRVRGLQSLGRPETHVRAPSRVAVNLRGVDRRATGRGDALLTPDAWQLTEQIDVLLTPSLTAVRIRENQHRPATSMLHIGTAAMEVRIRHLGDGVARLALSRPLPLRVGDHGLLHDPGGRQILAGVRLLDTQPQTLRRRGGARDRALALRGALDRTGSDVGAVESTRAARLSHAQRLSLAYLRLRDEMFVELSWLRAAGLPDCGVALPHGWRADPNQWRALAHRAVRVVSRQRVLDPLAAGMPAGALTDALGLPDRRLLPAVVASAGLLHRGGLVSTPDRDPGLPPRVEAAITDLEKELATQPYRCLPAARLSAMGLGPRELAAAARVRRVELIGEGLALLPGTMLQAWRHLRALDQPFTVSAARETLHSTRRVTLALLAQLDQAGATSLLSDGTRQLNPTWGGSLELGRTDEAEESIAAAVIDSLRPPNYC